MNRGMFRSQRGATLVVGLVMLVVITLMVVSAFRLSSADLLAVGNMQSRNEAIGAANKAIEQDIQSLPFVAADTISVHVNNDLSAPAYVVTVTPTCIRERLGMGSSSPGTDCTPNLDGTISCPSSSPIYSTVWDMDAQVTLPDSGAVYHVHQGVTAYLTQSQCDSFCPPAAGAVCN